MTALSLSDSAVITLIVAGFFVVLALLAIVRAFLRREPSPPSWHRYRAGVFLERDPLDEEREE